MSDRISAFIVCIIIVCSILLCIVPALFMHNQNVFFYQSRAIPQWTLTTIDRGEKGTVSVNSADLYELTALPGIGETIAQLIILEREENGPFYYPEDLEAVKGIGPVTLNKFRSLICLDLEESED